MRSLRPENCRKVYVKPDRSAYIGESIEKKHALILRLVSEAS
jgi:hypothetical protein